MYGNTHRDRGRGRGRGTRQPTPYPHVRPTSVDRDRLPSPLPDDKLLGSSPSEKTLSRANDDVRLANDWKTYYDKYFERDRYSLPRPSDTHRMPEPEAINAKIDAILAATVIQCSGAIKEHLQSCITAAEEKVKNPPASKEELMWRNLTARFESHYERTMSSMMDDLARTMLRIQGRDTLQKTESASSSRAHENQQEATETE